MSFLTEIGHFIKTDILGIEEAPKVQNAPKKENAPVIEVKTDAPEDKFVKNKAKSGVSAPAKQNGMSRKALEESINNIPGENFDMKKMIKAGLIENVTGVSKEDFDKLPADKKNLIISSIKHSVIKLDKMIKEGKINPAASKEELLNVFGNIYYKALENGDFKNMQEFDKAAGNIVEDLGKNFDKRTDKEQRKILKNRRIEEDKKCRAELEAVKNLPEEEREEATARIYRKYSLIRRGQFANIAAEMDSKTGVNAMILLDSKDMEYGAETILATRSSQEERIATADYANYDYQKSLINDYKEIGDKVQPENLQGFTQKFMSQKSADAAAEFQKDYKTDRDKYEAAMMKLQNGESLTDEERNLITSMRPEYYTATAKGIGQGALNNVNMSADEKAEFLTTWEKDALNYSDYKEVTSEVITEIANNPEHSELKTKMDEILLKEQKQEYDTAKSNKSNTVPDESNTSKISSNMNSYGSRVIKHTSKTDNKTAKNVLSVSEPISAEASSNSTEVKLNKANNNPVVIAQNIKEQGVQKTIETYGSDAIAVILNDAAFKHLRSKLTPIIKSYDLKSLINITSDCSDSAFVYICNVVNKDMVQNLIDYRMNTKGLNYAAKEQVENKKGEYAAA